MFDGNMDKIRSEAAMSGWARGSADKVYALAKAKIEQEHLEKSRELRANIASLETRLDRLRDRSAITREHLTVLLAEKNLSSPFEWMLGRAQLAYISPKIRKIEIVLGRATDELEQVREWTSSRLTELESEVYLAYERGQSFRELTGGVVGANKNLFISEEAYDEI